MRTQAAWLLLLLAGTGCDLRGFWGDSFLEDQEHGCVRTPCPMGSFCDADSGKCRAVPAPVDGSVPGCQGNDGCPESGLCRVDDSAPGAELAAVGACLPADKVCFVDGDTCQGPRDGSIKNPYCDISEPVGRCSYVALRPRKSGQRYGVLTVTSGKLTVFGPARGTPASLGGLEASDSADVTLLDVVVERPGQTAVRCTQGAQVALRRSSVQGSFIGVLTEGCEGLLLDSVRVSGNQNDGVHVGLGTKAYRIVNTLVHQNAFDADASAAGVYLGTGGRGSFAFNTVVRNGRLGQDLGGVTCDAAAILSDSIVWDNGVGARGTQLSSSCRLERIVVGTDNVQGTGAIKQDPQLDPVSFHLTRRSECCIDRAQEDKSVKADYEGTPRPQGHGYDIGFHELP